TTWIQDQSAKQSKPCSTWKATPKKKKASGKGLSINNRLFTWRTTSALVHFKKWEPYCKQNGNFAEMYRSYVLTMSDTKKSVLFSHYLLVQDMASLYDQMYYDQRCCYNQVCLVKIILLTMG